MIPPRREGQLPWPPPFRFRCSSRAKRIFLRIDPERGLEVVLPKGVTEKRGLQFLNAHRAWVERRASQCRWEEDPPEFIRYALPNQLVLPAIGQSWRIDYCQIQAARAVSLATSAERLVFFGNFDHFKPCVPLMTGWLKNQAKVVLPNLLNAVANACGLAYRKVGIRGQKTLWGSCNEHKDIQLNYKLILLPEDLVRYVMIHELCHTMKMDHSKSFWRLVQKHMPDYEIHVDALKESDQWIPSWLSY